MPVVKKRKGESTQQQYVRSAMTELKKGKLHSGSKTGPKVTNPKQAIAIGINQAKKEGHGVAKTPKSGHPEMDKIAHSGQNRRKRNKGRS